METLLGKNPFEMENDNEEQPVKKKMKVIDGNQGDIIRTLGNDALYFLKPEERSDHFGGFDAYVGNQVLGSVPSDVMRILLDHLFDTFDWWHSNSPSDFVARANSKFLCNALIELSGPEKIWSAPDPLGVLVYKLYEQKKYSQVEWVLTGVDCAPDVSAHILSCTKRLAAQFPSLRYSSENLSVIRNNVKEMTPQDALNFFKSRADFQCVRFGSRPMMLMTIFLFEKYWKAKGSDGKSPLADDSGRSVLTKTQRHFMYLYTLKPWDAPLLKKFLRFTKPSFTHLKGPMQKVTNWPCFLVLLKYLTAEGQTGVEVHKILCTWFSYENREEFVDPNGHIDEKIIRKALKFVPHLLWVKDFFKRFFEQMIQFLSVTELLKFKNIVLTKFPTFSLTLKEIVNLMSNNIHGTKYDDVFDEVLSPLRKVLESEEEEEDYSALE